MLTDKNIQYFVSKVTFYFYFFKGITIDTVDQGTYRIFAPNQEAMEEAKAKIATLLESRVCICTVFEPIKLN